MVTIPIADMEFLTFYFKIIIILFMKKERFKIILSAFKKIF